MYFPAYILVKKLMYVYLCRFVLSEESVEFHNTAVATSRVAQQVVTTAKILSTLTLDPPSFVFADVAAQVFGCRPTVVVHITRLLRIGILWALLEWSER